MAISEMSSISIEQLKIFNDLYNLAENLLSNRKYDPITKVHLLSRFKKNLDHLNEIDGNKK